MIVSKLLESSLRAIGVVGIGRVATISELTDSKEALNLMLGSLGLHSVEASTRENFYLVESQAVYTMGPGMNLNTARPDRILGIYLTDGAGVNYPPLVPMTEGEFRAISYKIEIGTPQKYFYHLTDTGYGSLYFDCIPDGDTAPRVYLGTDQMMFGDDEVVMGPYYTGHMDSIKPLSQVSSLTAEINLPGRALDALKWGLALRLCPEFGREPSSVVATMAQKSERELKAFNAASMVNPVDIEFSKRRESYSIFRGE